MIPQGVEVRSELQLYGDVLAFGFSEEPRADDDAVVTILSGELLDYITRAAETSPARFVVIDLRNVRRLSSTSIRKLVTLHCKQQMADWNLVLLFNDPVIRGVILATNGDRKFQVVNDEAELRQLVNRSSLPSPLSPSQEEREISFSESELANMEATGISLDDVIHAVERLRG